MLAARTKAAIVPVVCRRLADGTYEARHYEPIEVADASDAEVQRATQKIADALEDMISVAPDQWYTFKPVWPETQAEKEHLPLARCRAEHGGGRSSLTSLASARARGARRLVRSRSRGSLRGRLLARGLFALSGVLTRLPERPLTRVRVGPGWRAVSAQPARRRLVRANLERVCLISGRTRTWRHRRTAAAARDGRALDSLTRAAFGHYVRSYLEGATLQRYATAEQLARVVPDDAALARGRFRSRPNRPNDRRRPAFRLRRDPGSVGHGTWRADYRAHGDRGRPGHPVVLRAHAGRHRPDARATRGRRGQGVAPRWPATRRSRSSPTGR